MARITQFEKLETMTSNRPHTKVECGYRVVNTSRDEVLLQLDTYGSDGRQIPGKTSQSVQLDEAAALDLVQIILKTYPQITRTLSST